MLARILVSKALPLCASLPVRRFRHHPYLPTSSEITPEERETEKEKPVWERRFDFQKYMVHKGPLKLSTGLTLLDVEPFPRMKLMKLYYLILEEIKNLPDKYEYKFLSREITKYRMKVVDENESIIEIERIIGNGIIEELILQAHNELKLLRIMREWQPWDYLFNPEKLAEFNKQVATLRYGNPFLVEEEPVTDPRVTVPSREDYIQEEAKKKLYGDTDKK